MNAVRVECRNIALSYGNTQVLKGINLAIEPGEFFALLGPSGSGKSTLLRLIAGFNVAQAGQLLIDGNDLIQVPPWERNIGMVFQNYALWPHMTVERNIAFGLEERRLPRELINSKVRAMLELVGLTGYAKRRPGQLSGGQQQRVALARTLAIEPRVLLLDEPLSNLDAKLRVQMRQELKSLQRRLGITTIFVTHDQEEALTTCDRIAVMDQGVIQQIGTPVQLYDQPVNRFVANFVGTINLFEGDIQAVENSSTCRFVSRQLGTVPMPGDAAVITRGKAHLAIRPHSLTLADINTKPETDQVSFDASVTETEFLGEFVRYRVATQHAEWIADQPHRTGAQLFPVGCKVKLMISVRDTRVLPA
ncbi:MAG: ABC transporter ATP-binding protein [Betaproteobacteria bacterium]|nr:ABC transporter ATP-binding protein [Betaproteobacteria bacterium]